ncbi:hypothetical protein FJT64_013021 [Amphibalanus amphitrite]|uniref:Uncharacterized protein n=1 Tax=Amphibalanus amphitrite TaxID=1232801 RepID=A0A6A4VDZ4_AMPAM|nr:hypothetical protein FJT64_013021 [Amphibalanus amphitrite]
MLARYGRRPSRRPTVVCPAVVDAAAEFRRAVRSYALQDRKQRAELMTACDAVRDQLLKAGIKLQCAGRPALPLPSENGVVSFHGSSQRTRQGGQRRQAAPATAASVSRYSSV